MKGEIKGLIAFENSTEYPTTGSDIHRIYTEQKYKRNM
jgi:hypothetical protein